MNLETFADAPDIHRLVGIQFAEIFKKLRRETITIPMRNSLWFVGPFVDKAGKLSAITPSARFHKGIPHRRDIAITERGFDTTEHGDGRREPLDAWNIVAGRTMVKEVPATDLFECRTHAVE